MRLVKCLMCCLVLGSLLPGCNRAEQRVEDLETDSVREERRLQHEKMMPKAPGTPPN